MQQRHKTTTVAKWIFVGVFLLLIQVLLGGITRLTGSGLSITEWKPLLGVMPPMGEAAWQQAFDQYKQIAQYKYVNQHFTLSDFKFIFFWEWFHRVWARLIGVVFLIPFIYFLVKKYFQQCMVLPLIVLFLLGGLQGAVGWIMVKSGLNDSDVYVSHIRLAVHFMAAMLLICYAWVFGLKLITKPASFVTNSSLQRGVMVLLVMVAVQLVYGAFMAGLKAANAAPTWPLINGMLVPTAGDESIGQAIFHNKLIIHFIHRTLAYGIGIGAIAWWWKASRIKLSTTFTKASNMLLSLVLLQIALGIFTILSSPYIQHGSFGRFEWLAQLHQLTGMLLLLCLVWCGFLTRKQKTFS